MLVEIEREAMSSEADVIRWPLARRAVEDATALVARFCALLAVLAIIFEFNPSFTVSYFLQVAVDLKNSASRRGCAAMVNLAGFVPTLGNV